MTTDEEHREMNGVWAVRPPTEHDEAVLLKQYLDNLVMQKKVVCYSHIPQETFTKSWGTKMRNKLEGVNKGVPDYIIVLPDEQMIWIELKRTKGGVVSQEQKNWINALKWSDGRSNAKVCKGFDEAKEYIDIFI